SALIWAWVAPRDFPLPVLGLGEVPFVQWPFVFEQSNPPACPVPFPFAGGLPFECAPPFNSSVTEVRTTSKTWRMRSRSLGGSETRLHSNSISMLTLAPREP